ncbi:helix-turn-helix transcriptional regulator [Chloroflexota bacterium]
MMEDKEKTIKQLIRENKLLKRQLRELKIIGCEDKKVENDLQERIKELDCLYGLSKFASMFGISLEEVFQKTVCLIPPSWQYPDITCARIVFENKEFKTSNFKATKWTQSAEINIDGRAAGDMEVCYLKRKPERDEGPFLEEERALLEAMARQLGAIIDHKRDEESLRDSKFNLMEQSKALEDKNIALRELLVQVETEKRKIEEDVTTNIDILVLPVLKRIELESVNSKYVDLLRDTLKKLTASFGNKISQKRTRLTPREIEVCNMIKNGLTSKEISNLLNVSKQTIEWHRKSIRRKTELTNKDVNLVSYLMQL